MSFGSEIMRLNVVKAGIGLCDRDMTDSPTGRHLFSNKAFTRTIVVCSPF